MTEIEDKTAEPGTIVQEIQAGYMLGERLLRPALVGVAKKNNSKNQEKMKKISNQTCRREKNTHIKLNKRNN